MNANHYLVKMVAPVPIRSLVIHATAFLVILAKTAKRVCFFVHVCSFDLSSFVQILVNVPPILVRMVGLALTKSTRSRAFA